MGTVVLPRKFALQSDATLIRRTTAGGLFKLEDLTNCDVWVCDRCSELTVDNLKQCRVFVSAVEGSCFLRNCTACVFVLACQQLRTRECVDIDVVVCSSTGPVVESSHNVRFGCWNLPALNTTTLAFNLQEQLIQAHLDPWANSWADDLYDFTPSPDSWTIAEPQKYFLQNPPKELTWKEDQATGLVVPPTYGRKRKPAPIGDACCVLIAGKQAALAGLSLLNSAEFKANAVCIRAKRRQGKDKMPNPASCKEVTTKAMFSGDAAGDDSVGLDCVVLEGKSLEAVKTACQESIKGLEAHVTCSDTIEAAKQMMSFFWS